MSNRIAAALSLVAFATCIVMGMIAENPFSTVLLRGLGAMVVTLIVGMIVGSMGQKMLDENLNPKEKKPEISESKTVGKDR